MPPPLALLAIPGALQALYGGFQVINGNKKLNRLEQNRPERRTDPWLTYNQRLTQSYAGSGLGAPTYNAIASSNDRNFGAALGAIQGGGGSVNDVSRLYDQGQQAYQNLALLDAQWRQQNMQNFMQSNAVIAGENQKNWQWNQAQPWTDKYQRAVQQTNSGAQNIYGGLTSMSNVFARAGGSQKQYVQGYDYKSDPTWGQSVMEYQKLPPVVQPQPSGFTGQTQYNPWGNQ